MQANRLLVLVVSCAGLLLPPAPARGQAKGGPELDARVQGFLERTKAEWHDLNIPYADGRAL